MFTRPHWPSAAANVAGERRYLTVMFCDLVDSTGIAAKLDAGSGATSSAPYVDAASAAVMEMGRKVLGTPRRDEHSAPLALSAGLITICGVN
jgi:class 3 adenylate cyclase